MLPTDSPTYRVTETLHASEWTLVYRGLRCSDLRPIVLRVLGPRHALSADVERLEHELEIAGPLAGKSALQPLGLDRFQGLPALVLEDFDGHPLRTLLRGPMEPGRFLRLAVPIATALSDIHRSSVIHKDINPRSILVNETTGQVKLTEFGRATAFLREKQEPRNPALIEGTLAYMSPEQTGRMNRAIDYRSDLYSLGVTFFEMLTGRLPFAANDALEWVHCHVARQPPDPRQIIPGIPAMLSEVVLKLLAKGAEHRYQSAAGLAHDLERCRREWEGTGAVAPFALARRDWSERPAMPQKLYGRRQEAAGLARAFNRVATTGAIELVLVSGYSGIGKSSLVAELHRPVVEKRGLFLAGKFDQHSRDIPYAVLVHAFRELILDILTESDDHVAAWRDRLLRALGANGRLLLELIPQLSLIIGPQPPVPELRPEEARLRFAMVMRRFIGAFPARDRPVVLFLDDLQWADRASLSLLEDLARDPDVRSLLLVGAYRDNEVGPSHPLTESLREIRQVGAPLSHIQLGPLSLPDLRELVSEMLRSEPERTDELAALVHERTGGNPFFALQFLSMLYQDGLIKRDPDTQAWRWDLSQLAARETTSNVVDFILERVKRLTIATQELLALAACVGDTPDPSLLARVSGRSPAEVGRCLSEAAREGMLLRVVGGFRFAHDRVRHAAYRLLPPGERPATHLRIGRLLLAQTPAEARGEAVFEIVTHLNLGAALISDPGEVLELAELNLLAGRRAKASHAHAAAINYLTAGTALLGRDRWREHHDLTYEIELALAECELLSGDIDGSLQRAAGLLAEARTAREKVPSYLLQKDAHLAKGAVSDAVTDELAALALFGLELPPRPTAAEVAAARARVERLLEDHPIETIPDLPAMSDPDLEVALKVTSAASFTDRNLYLHAAAKMVALSLERGNAEGSVFWYGCYGFILVGLGEHREGHRFARAAFALQETRGFTSSKAQAHFFLSLTSFWNEPLAESIAQTRSALEGWSEAGPLMGAALATFNRVNCTMIAGEPLDKVSEQLDGALAFLRRIRFRDPEDMCLILHQMVKALQGRTVAPGSLSDQTGLLVLARAPAPGVPGGQLSGGSRGRREGKATCVVVRREHAVSRPRPLPRAHTRRPLRRWLTRRARAVAPHPDRGRAAPSGLGGGEPRHLQAQSCARLRRDRPDHGTPPGSRGALQAECPGGGGRGLRPGRSARLRARGAAAGGARAAGAGGPVPARGAGALPALGGAGEGETARDALSAPVRGEPRPGGGSAPDPRADRLALGRQGVASDLERGDPVAAAPDADGGGPGADRSHAGRPDRPPRRGPERGGAGHGRGTPERGHHTACALACGAAALARVDPALRLADGGRRGPG
jgi:predicted ATPase